ncbi:MAG: beta-L-arabinofuranosidase domain-containing protein [Bacteroidota bacterium]
MKRFHRQIWNLSCCLMLVVLIGCSGPGSEDTRSNKSFAAMQTPDFKNILLEGELGTRYQAVTVNLLTHTDRYSLASFAASASGKPGALWWDWPGDQIGRYLSCLHVAEGYGWSEAHDMRKAIGDIVLPLQNPEGNFGPPGSHLSDDVRLISGNGFCLRGLMDAYEDTGDPRFLNASERMARYFESKAPLWITRSDGMLHEFFGHCIDGLVKFYENTNQEWTIELARSLASHAGRTSHTHHSLSLYRGIIDLVRVTGDQQYLNQVKDYLKWCRENLSASGGLPEAMPYSYEDEGCGLTDWIMVNLMMFELTGDTRYVDDAELTLVNHFFMNQFNTGGFGHLLFNQDIVGGKGWQGWGGKFGSENPGCCSMWGQWGLGQIGRFLVTEKEDTVYVNLFASAAVSLPDKGVQVNISGDFPAMNQAEISLRTDSPVKFDLALRKPVWAGSMDVFLNDRRIECKEHGGYLHLDRHWKKNTTVRIQFANSYRIIPWPIEKPSGEAVFKGPLCLSLTSDKADINGTWTLVLDNNGKLKLNDNLQPMVTDSTGNLIIPLKPVGSCWLYPDTQEPLKRRILFKSPGITP